MAVDLNHEVTTFLDGMDHPLRKEIEQLRVEILNAHPGLTENIKWNGPNYRFNDEDRITMKIHPPRQIQLIFHRGVKKQVQPANRLIHDRSGLLNWKENDRAVATFKTLGEMETHKSDLALIIRDWIGATS